MVSGSLESVSAEGISARYITLPIFLIKKNSFNKKLHKIKNFYLR